MNVYVYVYVFTVEPVTSRCNASCCDNFWWMQRLGCRSPATRDDAAPLR